jgi:type II secretory pathway component GspD/PulD (secretin)/tetratricopeptide (TPR) repeat protein
MEAGQGVGGGKEAKVARASTKAWMGIVAGVALAGMTAALATPTGALGQTPMRPVNVHAALNSGIECYKKSDYEAAASYFTQVQASQDLSTEERQELNSLVRINNAALKERQEGRNNLQQAEQAAFEGRTSDAESLLKLVTINQFLSPEDKLKAQKLAEVLGSVPGGKFPTAIVSNNSGTGVIARNKLQQARNLMGRGNYDAAELLAHEVERMNVSFAPNEDTPRKVLGDVALAKAPKDAKGLLAASRAALQKGDLDDAERLAHQSEKAASKLTFYPWGDNPSKALKDVQQARLRVALESSRKTYQQSGSKESSPVVPAHAVTKEEIVSPYGKPPTDKLNEATLPADPHALLKMGREMYDSGNLDEAEKVANRAKASGPGSWGLFKDSPDSLLKDIHKARAQRNKDESVRLLAEARHQFEQGKYDEAKAKAYKAEELHGPYGLLDFGDRPMKLIGEIETAQAKAPKAKVTPVSPIETNVHPNPPPVAGGQGGGAAGPMSRAPEAPAAVVMPRADSGYQTPRQASGGYQMPSVAENGGSSAGANSTPGMPSIENSRTSQAYRLLAEARYHVRQGNLEKATGLVVQAESMGVNLDAAGENSPAAIRRDIDARLTGGRRTDFQSGAAHRDGLEIHPTAPSPVITQAAGATGGLAASAVQPVETPAKQQARQILVEARRLQESGNLVDARLKVLEALKLAASFGPNEDGPDKALLQLNQIVSRRIDGFIQEATDNVATANGDPARFRKAEDELVQARRLAAGFALDTQPIDAKMAWLRQTVDRTQGGIPPVIQARYQDEQPLASDRTNAVTTNPGNMPNKGEELLNKARMELRGGDTEMARRLAVEAYNGPYAVQAQADAVIHSIDLEEINQRTLTANRTFEAGLSSYQRKDYAQAAVIFRSVDSNLLPPDKQAKLRELLLLPEMQGSAVTPVVLKPASGSETGKARVGDAVGQARKSPLEENYAQQVQALQEIQFQKLHAQGLEIQREAIERFQAGETDRALQILQDYLASLQESQLEPQRIKLLRSPVDNRLQNFKALKAQQDFETQRGGDVKSFNELRQRQTKAEEHKQKIVEEQMKLYHAAYKEGRYPEAKMHAQRAHELDPDNAQASAAVYVAEMMKNKNDGDSSKHSREEMLVGALNHAEDEGTYVDTHDPVSFDKDRWPIAKQRKPLSSIELNNQNERGREIERKLTMPISLDFKNTPMSQVLDDLRAWTNINIVVDKPALDEEQHNLDLPVTMKLDNPVSTKSALKLLLHLAHLTYVVEDEVLKITTESHSKGGLVLQVHRVADLVVPIMNNGGTVANFIMGAQQNGPETRTLQTSAMPWQGPRALPTGSQVGSLQNNQSSSSSQNQGITVAKSNSPTMEDTLIKLITNMIKPESWESSGGPGTIDYFPLGMALTINQTPDIQEQVQELLNALRRLQDIEISIEVKFITISESYFERIGVDFNVNLETNNTKFEPMVVSQQFQPFGFINEPDPRGVVVGLQPTGQSGVPGQFTSSLDIPILNSSFAKAVPPFGGYPNTPGADGGLSLGLAFLSEIQVFLFMEAAQGDRRTNVMQAPKITLFNGQASTLTVLDTQFFVTDVTFLLVNGQLVFQPTNVPFASGLTLALNGVVTADRRFVRMSIAPTLTSLVTPTTALFPVTAFITPAFEGGALGQPVPFTMFLQQPDFRTLTVATTVQVPDGGTVLMGGLKTLSEGRNEFGPPILSKIPYINRLFKNVGYGRDTESLLMMVTPRIIINEEEEYRQTGVGRATEAIEAQQVR